MESPMSKICQKKIFPQDLIYLAPWLNSGSPCKAQSLASCRSWATHAFTGSQFGRNLTLALIERKDPFKSTAAATEILALSF